MLTALCSRGTLFHISWRRKSSVASPAAISWCNLKKLGNFTPSVLTFLLSYHYCASPQSKLFKNKTTTFYPGLTGLGHHSLKGVWQTLKVMKLAKQETHKNQVKTWQKSWSFLSIISVLCFEGKVCGTYRFLYSTSSDLGAPCLMASKSMLIFQWSTLLAHCINKWLHPLLK